MYGLEDFLAASGAGESTLRGYRIVIESMEKWMGKPMGEATKADLAKLKAKLRTMKSGYQYAVVARTFYRAAEMPQCVEIMKLKRGLRHISPDDYPTVAEVQKIIETCDGGRDRALIACLWETGVRIHELLAVDLGDVKRMDNGLKGFQIWFRKAKVRGREHYGYVLDTIPVLDAWIKAHPKPRQDAPLFPSWGGGRLGPKGGFHVVHGAAERALGAERAKVMGHPHAFRHARATYLLASGLNETQVANLLGWVPGSLMLRRYSHLTDRDGLSALLEGLGIEKPPEVDLGKLRFDEATLKPVVPMNAPPPAAEAMEDKIGKAVMRVLAKHPDFAKEVAEEIAKVAGA